MVRSHLGFNKYIKKVLWQVNTKLKGGNLREKVDLGGWDKNHIHSSTFFDKRKQSN
jgi:hypothetical protein